MQPNANKTNTFRYCVYSVFIQPRVVLPGNEFAYFDFLNLKHYTTLYGVRVILKFLECLIRTYVLSLDCNIIR